MVQCHPGKDQWAISPAADRDPSSAGMCHGPRSNLWPQRSTSPISFTRSLSNRCLSLPQAGAFQRARPVEGGRAGNEMQHALRIKVPSGFTGAGTAEGPGGGCSPAPGLREAAAIREELGELREPLGMWLGLQSAWYTCPGGFARLWAPGASGQGGRTLPPVPQTPPVDQPAAPRTAPSPPGPADDRRPRSAVLTAAPTSPSASRGPPHSPLRA